MPAHTVESAASPPMTKDQVRHGQASDAPNERDDGPHRNDSPMERFLHSLRIALSTWHT